MVSAPRRASQRRQKLHSRDAAHLERFCHASELRRLLETAGHALSADEAKGPESQCGGLVGPGRCLRADEDLRTPREKRSGSLELSCCRAVESWRLGAQLRPVPRAYFLWQRHLPLFPPKN